MQVEFDTADPAAFRIVRADIGYIDRRSVQDEEVS
jgi:hypothetical protein